MTVDAESWKSALTEARGGKSLSKFRVDFEEDGTVRVHDLVTNERFSLRPANAAPAQSAPEPAQSAPEPAPTPAPAPIAQAPIAQPAVAPVVPAPNRGSIVPPPGPTGRPSSAGFQAVVPPPASVVAPPRASSPAMVAVAQPAPASPAAPIAQPTPIASIPAPAPGSDVVVRAPGALFFSRDREAAASNGLTYRERLIAVPPQTSAEECTAIARDVWMQLRASLASMPSGKFISIAIFDHVFKSRPERPPIVVLGWKDWRGDEPDITVSRASAASLPAMGAVATPSIPPNSFAPPAPAVPTPAPIEVPAPAAQPSTPPPSASVSIAPQPKHTVAFAQMPDAVAAAIAAANAPIAQAPIEPPVSVAITAPPAPEPEPAPAPQPAVVSWGAPSQQVVAEVTAFAAPVEPATAPPANAPPANALIDAQPAMALSPIAQASMAPATVADLSAHVPEVAVESVPLELAQAVAPVPLVAQAAALPLVAPQAPVSVPPPRTAPSIPPSHQSAPPAYSAPPPAPKPSQPSVQKKPSRHRGDDLLSEAFDALSDMAFLAETQQATDFASQVTKDLLHTPFIAIWLYDIDKHELVLEHCERAPAAKGRRARVSKGELRADVVLRGTPAVLPNWEPDDSMLEAPMGPALFVSIALDRRLFGLLELHREVGDLPFEDDEEGTASYIAGQLAQFLADHSKRVGFQEDKPGAARRK